MKNNYKIGNIVNGCVTGIEKYGIFVSLDGYYSGLVHISEVSESFVRNLNDYVKIGETIKVKIIDVSEYNYHVKLSIKGFNYRITNKKRKLIQETPHGFNTLKIKLKEWIEEKNIENIKKRTKI